MKAIAIPSPDFENYVLFNNNPPHKKKKNDTYNVLGTKRFELKLEHSHTSIGATINFNFPFQAKSFTLKVKNVF